ncbi:MAG: serine/threonine-protein kinase [Pseudomonadales bacterium]
MGTFQQALQQFKGGSAPLEQLRSALLSDLAEQPDQYEKLRRETVRACKAAAIEPRTMESLLDAIDQGQTRIATIHSVDIPGQDDATVWVNGATAFADAAGPSAAMVAGDAPTMLADGSTAGEVPATRTNLPTDLQRDPLENTDQSAEGVKLKPGDILNNQFELEESVGEGGMGMIFRAKDKHDMQFSSSNPYVAVKVLSESFSGHRDSVMALHRETRNARKLRHDNIIRVDTFARDARTGQYFMVMEYLRGEPLNHYMRRKAGERLSYEEVWRICEGTGEGLKHAHAKGIIHSDIKPGNLWITEDGTVKVLDFGIAKVAKPDTQTVWQGLPALSVPYATQEMLRREDPDERDDIYALACVTYELLTGHHPFQKVDALQAETEGLQVERPPGLKAQQWRTLKQALNLHRDERTPTMADFLEGMRPTALPVPLYAGIATLAVLIGLLGLAWQQGVLNIDTAPKLDEAYVAAWLGVTSVRTLSNDELKDYLDEGHYVVDLGREEFDRGDFQEGNRSLKNGASTAFRAYHEVLLGTEDPMKRTAAATGIKTIQKTYADATARLRDEGMPKKALWLTCQALAQPPGTLAADWPPSVAQYEDLWREVKGEAPIPHAQGCTSSQVLDSWGNPLSLRSSGRSGWSGQSGTP